MRKKNRFICLIFFCSLTNLKANKDEEMNLAYVDRFLQIKREEQSFFLQKSITQTKLIVTKIRFMVHFR